MRRIVCVSILLVTTALTGCASEPTREEMAKEVEGFQLPKTPDKEEALIYVVRPSKVGAIIGFNVFVDSRESGAEMGLTRGNQYIYFYVTPGKHVIQSQAENWAELAVEVVPGEVLYIRQDPSRGQIKARNTLVALDPVEGQFHLKSAALGTVIKERP